MKARTMDPNEIPDRRQFLKRIVIAGAAGTLFSVRGSFAEELMRTPSQTEGPYYPLQLPLDRDNDLLVITDSITPAVGEILLLSGRVLTLSGNPVRNATVEIWQADNTGAYLHPKSMGYQNSRRELPGLRTLRDGFKRRIQLQDDQTRTLYGPNASHPFQDQGSGQA